MSSGTRWSYFLSGAVVLFNVAGIAGTSFAQTQPFDDHQNMMDQIGVHAIRPGPNPRDQTTFDEAKSNPYADSMPDVLKMKDGTKVTAAAQWPARRAEIVEDFEREVYGRIPGDVPAVTWQVTATTHGTSGNVATVTRTLVGHVDNSAAPEISVEIQASVTVPEKVSGSGPGDGGNWRIRFWISAPPRDERPGRSGGDDAAQHSARTIVARPGDRCGLGICVDQSEQRAAGQQSPHYRHHRPDQQRQAAHARAMGCVAGVAMGREPVDRLLRAASRLERRCEEDRRGRVVAIWKSGAGGRGI